MITFIIVMVVFIFFIGCAIFNKVCRMFNIMIANQRIINDNQKIIMEKIYDEGEKTREYLKAEIIKSENGYVHYEPNEEE